MKIAYLLHFFPTDGPSASLSGNNPAADGDFGPFNTVSQACTDASSSNIPILEANDEDVTVTCTAADDDPQSTITFYLGDGPTNSMGEGLDDGTDSVVAGPGGTHDGTDTELTYTFTNSDYTFANDNGKTLTCCAVNTVGTHCASACFEFIGKCCRFTRLNILMLC